MGITVAFARKSWMSPAALARIAVEAGGGEVSPEVYEQHDLIFLFFKGLRQPPRGSQ